MARICRCNNCNTCYLYNNAPQYFALFENLPVPAKPEAIRKEELEKHKPIIWIDTELVKQMQARKGVISPDDIRYWPFFARMIAMIRSSKDIGIGDTIHKRLKILGATLYVKLYKLLTGLDCDCPYRQRTLNKLYPYPR